MRWCRIFLGAVAATVFSAIWNSVMCAWLFKWVYDIPPIEFWKPEVTYTGSFWAILYIGSFILYFILAAVFGWIYKALPSKCWCCRGSAFGLIVWLVGTLPGMFFMYMFATIAPTVIIYWAISGLVSLQIVGLIMSAIYGSEGETGECCCK